jgi:hypothetical protein
MQLLEGKGVAQDVSLTIFLTRSGNYTRMQTVFVANKSSKAKFNFGSKP